MTARAAYRVTALALREPERLFAVRASAVNVSLPVGKFPFLKIEKVPHLSGNSKEPLVFPPSLVCFLRHTAIDAPDHYRHYQRVQNCRAHKAIDNYQHNAYNKQGGVELIGTISAAHKPNNIISEFHILHLLLSEHGIEEQRENKS